MRLAMSSFAALLLGAAPLHGQEASPPPIVVEGLTTLNASGVDSAVAVWFKGSSLEGDTASAGQITSAFAALPEWLGKPIGYELLKTYRLGTHVSRTYALVLFEGGPMYFRFTYYLGPKGWTVLHLDFHTDADKILPSALQLP